MPKSGGFGVVDGIASVINWSINDANTLNEVRASNTRNGTTTSDGVEDWTGSFEALGGNPVVMPGEYFDFSGFAASDDGTLLGTGDLWGGEAMILDVTLTWDWTTNAVIRGAYNFGGNGPLAITQGNLLDSTNPPLSQYPKGLWLMRGAAMTDTYAAIIAAGDPSKIRNVSTATFNLVSAVQTHVDSETGGYTGRVAGPLNWTLTLTQNNIKRSELLQKNATHVFVLPTKADNSLFWGLKWGKVQDITGITVDNDGGTILSATTVVKMHGAAETEGLGEIMRPGGAVAWWPITA